MTERQGNLATATRRAVTDLDDAAEAAIDAVRRAAGLGLR